MAASVVARLSSAALILATVVLGQGEKKYECDVEGVWMCYSHIGDLYGMVPLANNVPQDKNDYLQYFCKDLKVEQQLPAEPECRIRFPSCSDADKKKFTRMEAGYTALREAISTANQCESVANLRECLNLDVIRRCEAFPDGGATFEENERAKIRGAQNLKKCLAEAVKPCEGKQNAQAIAQLDKIATAIIDLSSFSDGKNSASKTNAAMGVMVSLLLIFFRGIY
uniref:Putative secreted protein n=1 Tax=Amblyomma triste TaxID=251400 RepID=A0A023G1V6_AMBTT